MNRRFAYLAIFSIVTLIMGGCVHAISRQNRQDALKGLTAESILRDFDIYRGKLVLMGGEIIETKNLEEVTLIEVLQKPLNRHTDQPLENRNVHGRFLVKYETFKDPYVFSQGREITVAGIVLERKVSKIDEREYTYIVLENRETHLWPERKDYYGYYPYWYPYHPYWHPYYPWWHHPYYHHYY